MPTKKTKTKEVKKTRSPTKKHRDAFEAWYAADRSCLRIMEKVGVSEQTLYNWADWFNWHDLADKRDAEAQKIADAKAIKDRAKRLEEQRKAGSLLRVRGMQLLGSEGFSFDSSADAIRAIKTGIDIERQADGLPDNKTELTGKDGAPIPLAVQFIPYDSSDTDNP